MDEKGWYLTWAAPHLPSFQPIKLSWGYGKGYIRSNFDEDRKLNEVHDEIRQGWCGNKDLHVQGGRCKRANSEGFQGTPSMRRMKKVIWTSRPRHVPGGVCSGSMRDCIESAAETAALSSSLSFPSKPCHACSKAHAQVVEPTSTSHTVSLHECANANMITLFIQAKLLSFIDYGGHI